MRTDESTLQMQPPARPVYPRTWKPRSTCSNCRACHPHACCAGPSAARKAAPRHACRRTTLLRVICANAASRLLRLYLSACGARQAAPLLACRRAPHLRVHSIDPVAIATSALSNSLAVSYSNSTLHVEHMSFKPISFPS